ncbi:MAG TPA: extracellular solute-binding protein [Acidimicrobiales bacterium]|nr:extracellular solute-binding protein [Acidimicrobiales bacterium]
MATSPGELPDCPLDALEEASRPVEITLWYGGLGGSAKATIERQVAAFDASRDDVVVTADDQGGSYEQVYRKYTSAAAADRDQLPDVIYLEDTQLQAMADSGQVLPAQACMEASGYDLSLLEPAVVAKYSVDGVLLPGYANVSTPVLYYNKAHFARAGLDPDDPPGTLEELGDAARALQAAGVSDKPLSFRTSRWYLESWLTGSGVPIVDNDDGRSGLATRATFATPEAEALLSQLARLREEGLLNVFAATEGSIDQYLALVTQESSMLVETSTASTTIRDALGGSITAEEAGVDVGTSAIDLDALVPGSGAYPGVERAGQVFPSGAGFYMLNTSSPAQQAASWRFLEFMLDPANAKAWTLDGGYLPAVRAVRDDPEVRDFWTSDLAGLLLRPAADQLAEADPGNPGPLIGPYSEEAEALQGAMEAVLLEGRRPGPALEEAQDAVTEALRRYAG